MRALETGRYLLRATNTGISAIVDPAGEVVKHSRLLELDVLSGEIQPMAGSTPYARFGNLPLLALLLVSLILAFPCGHNRFRRRSGVDGQGEGL
jgi:apolipoprotein N-acyltransferase